MRKLSIPREELSTKLAACDAGDPDSEISLRTAEGATERMVSRGRPGSIVGELVATTGSLVGLAVGGKGSIGEFVGLKTGDEVEATGDAVGTCVGKNVCGANVGGTGEPVGELGVIGANVGPGVGDLDGAGVGSGVGSEVGGSVGISFCVRTGDPDGDSTDSQFRQVSRHDSQAFWPLTHREIWELRSFANHAQFFSSSSTLNIASGSSPPHSEASQPDAWLGSFVASCCVTGAAVGGKKNIVLPSKEEEEVGVVDLSFRLAAIKAPQATAIATSKVTASTTTIVFNRRPRHISTGETEVSMSSFFTSESE